MQQQENKPMIDLQATREARIIKHLKSLIGFDCTIRLRSSPETLLTGPLICFDLDTVPSLLVIDSDRGRRIVNFQDVSFIEEHREG